MSPIFINLSHNLTYVRFLQFLYKNYLAAKKTIQACAIYYKKYQDCKRRTF